MAYETTSEAREPVQDWASDWDWLDEQWGPNAPEIWRDLREAGCPMAFTERYGRAWMPVTHEAIAQIANDTEHFSSYRVSVSRPDSPLRKAPPITLDPPEHHAHRRILLPPFNPKRVAELEQPTRRYCQGLIAKLAGRFRADAAVDYAQNIPVHVIAGLIGVPESDADIFRDWVHRNFQEAPRDNKAKEALMADMWEYFGRLLDARTLHPQGDLTSMLIDAEIEGRLLTRDEQIGYLVLLILAGIDTTWGSIGSGLWYFSQNPEHRRRLAAAPLEDPLWVTATEEVLRFFAPVTMARQVIADTEVSGCPIHKGDQVLLPFGAASRDPAVMERPEEFILDRAINRHSAFGLGIHRCLGSNLARMEMLVAFQEWIRAFPDYSLDTSAPTTWASGQVRGPRSIPVHLQAT